MSEEDRAVVRSCLCQVQVGMAEARHVTAFWKLLTYGGRCEWSDFALAVGLYLRQLEGKC